VIDLKIASSHRAEVAV